MNIVLDDAVEEKAGGEKVRLGMVVRTSIYSRRVWEANRYGQVIRGNSVVMLEVSSTSLTRKWDVG